MGLRKEVADLGFQVLIGLGIIALVVTVSYLFESKRPTADMDEAPQEDTQLENLSRDPTLT